jgi:hypothetical protein
VSNRTRTADARADLVLTGRATSINETQYGLLARQIVHGLAAWLLTLHERGGVKWRSPYTFAILAEERLSGAAQ